MSQNHKAPYSAVEPKLEPDQTVSIAAETPVPAIASDRLYQFASVTAGIFLLATLL